MANTNLDPLAYHVGKGKCAICHNRIVISHSGRPYCVRCNRHIPDQFIRGNR